MSVGGYLAPDLPVDPIPVPRTKEAEEMVIQAEFFFHEEARRADKVAREDGALWSRVSECAQRIALIHALGRGIDNPVIELSDINFGLCLATYSLRRWAGEADKAAGRSVVGTVDNEAKTRRAIAVISKNGGKITKSQLARTMNFTAKQVSELIDDLESSEYIEVIPGGRMGSFVVVLASGLQSY